VASIDDYLSGSPLFSGGQKKAQEYDRLLQQLSNYQVNRVAGQALGLGDLTQETQPGLIARTVGGAGGALGRAISAPGMFIRRNLLGVEGGGELFKTKKSDSVLERGLKLGAAFAVDTVTDPITWFGAPASLGRRFVATTIADPVQASRLLNVAEESLKLSGRNADEVTSALAQRSVNARLARQQVESGVEAVEKTPAALFDLSDPAVRRGLAGEELSRVISESLVVGGRGAVTRNLTEIFGDASIAEKVFKELPDVARGGVFLVNPITGRPIQRVLGGSGTPSAAADVANRARLAAASSVQSGVKKLTGGHTLSGKYGTAWADVNAGLRAFSKDPSSLISSNLGRTTVPAYTAFRSANRASQALRHSLLFKARVSLEKAPIARQEFDAADHGLFDETFSSVFQLPGRRVDESNPAAARAAAEARILRESLDEWKDEAAAVGLDISDLGPDYVPLMYTEDTYKKMLMSEPRGVGTRSTNLLYNTQAPRSDWLIDPSKQPNQWEKTLKAAGVSEGTPLEEAVSAVGFQLPDGRVALAPKTINSYLRSIGELAAGESRFLEDPLLIMQRYSESMSGKIASQKLVNDGLRSGILIADPMSLATQARVMTEFIDGVRKVSPDIARRAEQALNNQRQRLVAQAAAGSEQVVKAAREQRMQAKARYQVAKDNEAAVVRSLREAVEEVDRLRRQAGNINPLLRTYGREGGEELAEQLSRARVNVKAKFARAQKSLKETKKAEANLVRKLDRSTAKTLTAEDRASELLFEAEVLWGKIVDEGAEPAVLQNYRKLEDLLSNADSDVARLLSKEKFDETLLDEARALVLAKNEKVSTSRLSLASTEEELRAVRNTGANLRAQLTEQQQGTVEQFERALLRKSELDKQLESAVTIRNEFRPNAMKLSRKIPLESSMAVDTLAVQYSDAYRIARQLDGEYKAAKKAGIDTSDIKIKLDAARKASMDAKRALSTAVGSWGGKDSVVANYRRSLIKAAQDLSAEELAVARIVFDDGRLGQLLDDAASASGTRLEAVAADLKEVFFNIRNKMTAEDYAEFKDSALMLQSATSKSDIPLTSVSQRASNFGEFLNENKMTMIGAGTEGGSVAVPGSLSNLHAPDGVREVLENMYRFEMDAEAAKGFFAKFYDPLLLLWKTGVTVGRGPSYTMMNTVGGIYMNYLAGVSIKTHTETAAALVAIRNAESQARKELPNAGTGAVRLRADELAAEALADKTIAGLPAVDVIEGYFSFGGREVTQTFERMEQFSRSGVAIDPRFLRERSADVKAVFREPPTGKGEAAFRKTIEFGLTNRVQLAFNDMAQTSEMFLRISAYGDGLAKYGSKNTAWDQMVALHFDYQDLSPAEQSIRRLVPFYTWTRNNVPSQLRALFIQPGKIKRVLYAREEFKNAFGTDEEDGWMNDYLPEYIGSVGGFATMFGGDTPVALMGRLPLDDLDRLANPSRAREELVQMLGPFQSAIDIVSGYNSATGEKFNPIGDKTGGYLSALAEIPGLGKTGPKGEKRVSAGAAAAITEFLPQLGIADRALSGAAFLAGQVGGEPAEEAIGRFVTDRNRERGLQNFLNSSGIASAGGFSAGTLTPGALSGEVSRRAEEQNAKLINKAGEMGVSVSWIRRQIREGRSAEQIAMLIALGEGTIEAEEREQDARGRGRRPNERYRDVLRGVQSGQITTGY
jgi:hypothetical protein